MLFDQDRLDAIIHNWKNQVFSNKTIHGVPRSAFDLFEAAYRRVPEPRFQFLNPGYDHCIKYIHNKITIVIVIGLFQEHLYLVNCFYYS